MPDGDDAVSQSGGGVGQVCDPGVAAEREEQVGTSVGHIDHRHHSGGGGLSANGGGRGGSSRAVVGAASEELAGGSVVGRVDSGRGSGRANVDDQRVVGGLQNDTARRGVDARVQDLDTSQSGAQVGVGDRAQHWGSAGGGTHLVDGVGTSAGIASAGIVQLDVSGSGNGATTTSTSDDGVAEGIGGSSD
jgi:hypothetical protein